MRLIHTLLVFIRENNEEEDVKTLNQCLESLEKSTYKTVVIYNQGFWDNERVESFVRKFDLNPIIIGRAKNDGIVKGRQSCFEYVWENYPDTEFITELHLDMMFTYNWEDPLIEYLIENGEPVVGCGIVDKNSDLMYTGLKATVIPEDINEIYSYLTSLRRDLVINGFTHPCIHKSNILKEIGGFDTRVLKGNLGFEDDSCLLGYFYYYGTKANWRPKVCYKSVVYHATEKQRFGTGGEIWKNFDGLVKQYGAMGLLQLSRVHVNLWSKTFFKEEFEKKINSI